MEGSGAMRAPNLPQSRWLVYSLPFLLAACAAPPKPLYQWGNYQSSLYVHLKGEDAKAQEHVEKLEVQLQETERLKNVPPPGLHGHLALLYSKLGKSADSRRHLEAERLRFPESAAYVDLLLRNAQKIEATN